MMWIRKLMGYRTASDEADLVELHVSLSKTAEYLDEIITTEYDFERTMADTVKTPPMLAPAVTLFLGAGVFFVTNYKAGQ